MPLSSGAAEPRAAQAPTSSPTTSVAGTMTIDTISGRPVAKNGTATTIRADADLEVALDLIYAPLFFRLLIGHGGLDRAFTDALLDLALEGMRERGDALRSSASPR
ncbi:MAG TPA: TetR-like C-terminal domain-containing protein [Croceibacterium sp.]